MPDLVAVRAPTARMFIRAWDRVTGEGGAILPIDPKAPDSAVARLVRSTRPTALITTAPGRPDQLRTVQLPGAEPVRTGTAVVIATSGSTGTPKAVVLSEMAMEASTRASLDRLGCADGERWLLCLPWHHIAGIGVIRRSRALGVEPELVDRFAVTAMAAALASRNIRWISLVPTQLRRLLDADVDLTSLRGVLLGGAAADPTVLSEARARGVHVVTSYGMTETCGGCVYDGEPLDGVDAAVLADGRIRLSGPVVGSSYRLDPANSAKAFTREGFVTNDLGRFDDRGRLEVLGRADDMVVSGGENVPAQAVAAALRTHPDILDALVVGAPDDLWGHVVCAAVVTRDGADLDLDAVRDHVAASHPRVWAPRRLVEVDQIPVRSSGKPDRLAVRNLFA